MSDMTIGWIGMGRMGFPMAERLVEAGYDVRIWNRTRAKAEPLAAKGATLVDSPRDLAGVDVLFTMVSTGRDVDQVCFGENGVLSGDATPGVFVDWSSIGVEQSADLRAPPGRARGRDAGLAGQRQRQVRASAGKLSAVVSGPRAVFDRVEAMIGTVAASGVS